MHKIHRGTFKMPKITGKTSKYVLNPTRIFRKCTKSHDWLRIIHKIPLGFSNNAQNLIMNFQNEHNPMRNFQKCRKSHKKLPKNSMKNFKNILWVSPKMQKITWRTSKMQNIPLGTSKNAQDVFGICLVLSVNRVHILAWDEINDFCRLAENRIIITYGCVRELRICS
jgi:hypothetical protein